MKIRNTLNLWQVTLAGWLLFGFTYTWASTSPSAVSCQSAFSNFTELAQSVSKNAEFSNSAEHHRLFELYRRRFLSGNDTRRTLKDVMDIVKRHPELSKPALREQILTFEQRNYEPSSDLEEVVQRLKNSASQFSAQVVQPEANMGFWQRLLMPFNKEELNGLSRQEQKAKQKEHKAQFREYFYQVFSQRDLAILNSHSIPSQEKTIHVYKILSRIRTQMMEEGKDVKALSQAMVDLVHTSGFRNPHYINMLKSENALDQLKGLEYILEERDRVAVELGFAGHFLELQRELNVDHPIGSTKTENLSQVLLAIQKEIQNSSYVLEGEQVFRVRALSLQESPFRGCLGGDCSTDGYFDLALDPNFLYFTLTDQEFQSSGHITLVLGTAYSQKEKRHVKIAFVDKIQNVSQVMILPMLEAVRLSLEELGYRLGLSVNGGDQNGLSNNEKIRNYMIAEVSSLLGHQLKDFTPHKNHYNFNQGHSRAYNKPRLLEFERYERDFTIEAGEIYTRSKIPEDSIVADLFQKLLSLKDSKKEEDQIRFINQLLFLTKIKELELSEEFAIGYLNSKVRDQQVSFKVRKKALYNLFMIWAKNNEEKICQIGILHILENFSLEERTEIMGDMSNWKNSNEWYRRSFIDIFSHRVITSSISTDTLKAILHSSLGQIIDMNAGWSSLFQAVRTGDQKKVKHFLDLGFDINVRNEYGQTVLFEALQKDLDNGDQSMVKFLLDLGADVNASNTDGQNLLERAAMRGNLSMVKLLLDHGADVNAIERHHETALFELVRYGEISILKLLLDYGANVNIRNHYGETALSVLIRNRGIQSTMIIAQLLLDHGADVNIRNHEGETVLFKVVKYNQEYLIPLLLDHGANVNIRNHYGETVLSIAWKKRDQIAIKKLLAHEGITQSQYAYSRLREMVTTLWSRFFQVVEVN